MRRILLRCPALSASTYGEYCRGIIKSLRSNEQNDVYLLNIDLQNSGWISRDDDERAWIDNCIRKTASVVHSGNAEFSLSIQVQPHTEWQRLAPYNIGVTLGTEISELSEELKASCNQMDHIVVPSTCVREKFGETFTKDVTVISTPVVEFTKTQDIDINNATSKFNFLVDTKWEKGSNLEGILLSFVQEFQNEDVGLILKTEVMNGSEIDRHHTARHLSSILDAISDNRKCSVSLLHGNMNEEELSSVYLNNNISAYISARNDSQYEFSLLRAASASLPILAPHEGSARDIPKDFINCLEYSDAEENQNDIESRTVSTSSIRSKMRAMHTNISTGKSKAKKLYKYLKENFTEQQINLCYNNVIDSVLETTNEGDNTNETKRSSISSNHDGSTEEPTGAN